MDSVGMNGKDTTMVTTTMPPVETVKAGMRAPRMAGDFGQLAQDEAASGEDLASPWAQGAGRAGARRGLQHRPRRARRRPCWGDRTVHRASAC